MPSNGNEIQSEWFVPRRHGPAAVDAVRRRADRIRPLVQISEFRSIAADQLWLSGAYDRDAVALHFTWVRQPDAVDAAVREVEAALEPFAARPHWGKVNHTSPARLAELWPRLGDARALFDKLDPDGTFSNARLERLGVRTRGSPAPRRRTHPAALSPGDPARRPGRLVLIRRTRPGQAPYWTTAGGGVEDSDESAEAALHRELRELREEHPAQSGSSAV